MICGIELVAPFLRHLLARLHDLLADPRLILAHHLLKQDWILRHRSSWRGHW